MSVAVDVVVIALVADVVFVVVIRVAIDATVAVQAIIMISIKIPIMRRIREDRPVISIGLRHIRFPKYYSSILPRMIAQALS